MPALTATDLAKIAALCEAATGEPWSYEAKLEVVRGVDGLIVAETWRNQDANGIFIAASRTWVPQLLADLREAKESAEENDGWWRAEHETRLAREEQLESVAMALGCEHEWSNLHDHGSCVLNNAHACVAEAKSLRSENEDLRSARERDTLEQRVVDAAMAQHTTATEYGRATEVDGGYPLLETQAKYMTRWTADERALVAACAALAKSRGERG